MFPTRVNWHVRPQQLTSGKAGTNHAIQNGVRSTYVGFIVGDRGGGIPRGK